MSEVQRETSTMRGGEGRKAINVDTHPSDELRSRSEVVLKWPRMAPLVVRNSSLSPATDCTNVSEPQEERRIERGTHLRRNPTVGRL